MNTEMIIKRMSDVPPVPVERSKGATIQVLLGPGDPMPNFYTRCFTLEPGATIPAHSHDTIEHEQVMLDGQMVITIAGRETVVNAGDVIYIPAKASHAYRNEGTTNVRFLCMVPATDYTTQWL